MINDFYEELEYVSEQFPKHHVKILFGYFSAMGGKHEGERILSKLRCRWEDNIKVK
jgi:hypothetical protein